MHLARAGTPRHPPRAAPPRQPDGPRPLAPYYGGDWAAGCDNVLSCEALSLRPEDGNAVAQPIMLQIGRPGGAGADVTLRVRGLDSLPADLVLVVDGRLVTRFTGIDDDDDVVLSGAEALRAVRLMADATTIEIRTRKKGVLVFAPSTAGLTAALQFIDARQGRTGSTGALVQPGTAAESQAQVPPAPSVPQLTAPDADSAPALSPAELAAARRLAVCDASLMAETVTELFPLGGDAALLLLPCEAGTYNVSAVPLVARGAAGRRILSVAAFDYAPGFTGEPGKPPLVVNALWDARRGILSSLAKGRGIGDCGASEDYVWDGERFRLIESRAMHVCRGAWEWLRLWHAEPRPAAAAGPVGTPAATPTPTLP